MFSKTTGRYVIGTMIGLFAYELLDETGIVGKLTKAVRGVIKI